MLLTVWDMIQIQAISQARLRLRIKMQPLSPSPEQTVAQHIQVQALMYHSILASTLMQELPVIPLLQKQAKEPEKVRLMVQFLR